MADRKQTMYKKTSDKDISSLIKTFRQLSPTKRKYAELTKSDSTSSMSSGSSFASTSSRTMDVPSQESSGSSKYQSAISKPETSGLQRKDVKQEKELLQMLEKHVKDTSKTLNEYVAVRNRNK